MMELSKDQELKILFIGKKDDFFSNQAAQFIQLHYPSAKIIYSNRENPFPEELLNWSGDLIISYLSQWILPAHLLQSASLAALNLHPGPPEYPGIGCTNFAIYDGAAEFGVTCHHMNPKVDTGDIVLVKRFPIFKKDTVYSLTQRCYSSILNLFYEVLSVIMKGEILPSSKELWTRKPYLRKELNELCRLTPEMSVEEIERRIKATTYIQPWAFMQVDKGEIKLTKEDIIKKTYLGYLYHSAVS